MALFLSKSVHKVDKKGRVSVPAAFRAALGDAIEEGLALTIPLNGLNAIEGAPLARVYERIEQLEDLNSDSDEYGALALMTLGNMRQQTFDAEGRIVLPEDFAEHAGIGEQALFVGLGKTFQIWEPEAFQAHYLRAQEIARKNIGLLKSKKERDARTPGGEGGP